MAGARGAAGGGDTTMMLLGNVQRPWMHSALHSSRRIYILIIASKTSAMYESLASNLWDPRPRVQGALRLRPSYRVEFRPTVSLDLYRLEDLKRYKLHT